ncbi:MAG: putative 4-hydroxybenzoate polyprenyltransferase [Dehalococcoidales bacterium]|nr:putative 4-hydroxybenzoate polyprenyltransferase [Dehalococcoidales bacterium]
MERAGILNRVGVYLEAVKFEHTIFALPFAYLGVALAAGGLPRLDQFVWVTVAMASARTLAMAANRLIDWHLDAINPRTARRALPLGQMDGREMLVLCLVSLAVFVLAAWQLNLLCLLLLPGAVVVLVGYPYTKRFTWLSHWILGIADGLAPVGGWIAITATMAWPPIVLGLAVTTWIAGFDLIYACQDVEFDRAHKLHSVPARFGVAAALRLSSLNHVLTVVLLGLVGYELTLAWPFWLGLAASGALLAYEHSIVHPDDLSRLDLAFFNINGYIAVIMFVATFASLYV